MVGGKQVLNGVSLVIGDGETHALFGPNGCGKTTLLSTVAGIPRYEVIGGSIRFNGRDITTMPIYERARLGIGIAFQNPPAIRGLKLKEMISLFSPKADSEAILNELDFGDFADREVNRGLSGGEVKRSELVQLRAQEPYFVMLDEPDSGVDLENIKLIGDAINRLTQKDLKPSKRSRSGLIITHFGHILDHISTDKAHVMIDGTILCSGGPKEILEQIKEQGYEGCAACLCQSD